MGTPVTRSIIGIALGVLLSVLAVKYCTVPWAALLFILAMSLVVLIRPNRDSARIASISASAVLIALAGFEAYLGVNQIRGDGTRLEGTITEDFTYRDDTLGYAPKKNSRATARKYYENELLYDVAYTISEDGLRVSPPVNANPPDGCVVFFGDSVTFGEGVADEEALPYQVGLKTDARNSIYNFAFSGYGPHQMLARLQSDLADQVLRCSPTQFIYLALPEHISRVAGLTLWDKHGPRFELNADGTVVRKGNFDDPLFKEFTLLNDAKTALDRSFTYQRLFGRSRDPTPSDLDLFVAVVVEAARLTRKNYPDSRFAVILWDGRADPRLKLIETRLKAAGITVHGMMSAIPDFMVNFSRYILSEHDPHPNRLQNERVADYIVREILDRR